MKESADEAEGEGRTSAKAGKKGEAMLRFGDGFPLFDSEEDSPPLPKSPSPQSEEKSAFPGFSHVTHTGTHNQWR